MTSKSRLLAATAMTFGLGVLGAHDAAAEWKPFKPVEFIIMAGQGGGADRLARFIQSIVEKHDLSPMPFIPINKGGGSGAEGLRYLKDKEGDPHVIMATLNSYYTTPLRQPEVGVDISEFTPIARLAEDYFVLWVSADSPDKDLDSYVANVKEKGKKWRMGGTGTGQEDSLVTTMLENDLGLTMTYVPFKGGGDVAKALIGDHIESTVNNPSEQMGFFEADKSRPIAAFTEERIAAFPDTPTFKELGHPDLVYQMQRSVVAPGGIDKDVQDFYINVFKQVYESQEWQDYCKSEALECAWLADGELQDYFMKEQEKHRKILQDMGELPS
ncbi:MAG: tripartite tricarboxylate transporter substrate binding protein [Geminicoccaceae bacterium]|nr:tripartite tricarboxylate transporter substrate binding protein [Geminicoccaceae bacterium]